MMHDRECSEIIEVAEGPSICVRPVSEVEHRASAMQEESAYGVKVWMEKPFADVLSAARDSLSRHRCSILCEHDMRAMLSDSVSGFPNYTILQISRTDWVRDALEFDRDIGLLLPFNMVVYEQSGGTVLEAVDPIAKFALAGGADLQRLARAVKQTLNDVIDHVAANV